MHENKANKVLDMDSRCIYIVCVKKKPSQRNWRPSAEDVKLIEELKKRLGVSEADILRIGIRKLAQEQLVAK